MQSVANYHLLGQGKLMSISSIVASQEPIQRRAHPYHHPDHFRSPSPGFSSSSSLSSPRILEEEEAPLTLEERRLRNKAASAKYRQKKNQQQNEMKHTISRLSEQNAVLERQLQELRMENERLKMTSDKLRGKMEARKMIKKWMSSQQSYADVSDDFISE
ncbi:hypothetical protein G6F56_000393 [Rhizopus delemar]|nr:hypothetical protein G6F56_000393 [Rhizopus delemar]